MGAGLLTGNLLDNRPWREEKMIRKWQLGCGLRTALRAIRPAVLLPLGVAVQVTAASDGDPSSRELMQGRIAFLQCQACHVVTGKDDGGKLGPSLYGIFGRVAGTSAAYSNYSEALRSAGFTWDAETMDAWLAAPDEYLPGNTMAFAGIKDTDKRTLLVRYLRNITAEDQ